MPIYSPRPQLATKFEGRLRPAQQTFKLGAANGGNEPIVTAFRAEKFAHAENSQFMGGHKFTLAAAENSALRPAKS